MKTEYEYDPERGEMFFMDANVVLLEKRMLASIQRGHEKIIGDAAKRIIYTAAKEEILKFLKGYIKFLLRLLGKVEGKKKVFENLIARSAKSGYGVPNVEEFDENIPRLVFTMKNSFVAKEYGKSNKPVCHFLAGIVAGLFTGLFDRNMDCEEIECIAKGDPVCRFVAEPAKNNEVS